MRRFWRGLRVVAMVCVAALVFGYVTMHLWNWLMPATFGLKAITFAQALGLLVLSKILLGDFIGMAVAGSDGGGICASGGSR